MNTQTRISDDFKIVVPIEVREKLDMEVGDFLLWKIDNNRVNIEFENKVNWEDVIGMVKLYKKTNAVELKKKSALGVYKF
ncbi:MAG: AbrB/MazE/SpoVT family DNA-binding domain-containing protein [Methanobrevibacter sp.]|jgi:bifunctional DNA-binding transcriptional regulator/antitoxin component of YhaV-PrlF toxin-antitoxin module|nr:AbrB/MazE/SpoVT family DNA-binding domain-containing protein [Methanobrevibacter sp.]